MRAAAALLLLAVPAHAHLVILCTSSDPAKPGELSFYLGTYHQTACGGGGSVPGTMHIQGGSGTVQTASFNNADCAANRPVFSSNPTGSVYVTSLIQTWGLPANAVTQCYTRPGPTNGNAYNGVVRTNADGSDVYDAAVLGSSEASESAECYPTTGSIESWYRVVATNAQSGTFEVWTSGTNNDLNPGSGLGNPCTMAVNRIHFQMALTVVTGGQACQPFTGSVTGATVGADCAAPTGGTVAAGLVCTIPCNKIQAGELKCDDGNWLNTYSCVANTCSSAASSTFTGQSGVAAPCTFSTAEGDSCTPACTGADVPIPAGATVACQADGTWVGSGHCGAAAVTACDDGQMNGDETGTDCGGSCPTPCSGGAVVSGDPFTKYGGKTTQFYLPLGTEHTLLTCPTVELRGRTKHSGVPGDTQQWFDRFTVLTGPPAGRRNTVTVGLLGAMSTGGTTSTARKDRVIAALQKSRRPAQLAVLNLTVDGVAAAGDTVLPPLAGGWKVEAKHIGHAEVVALAAGDVKVRLQSAIAQKYAAAGDNLQHMHIDVEFDGLDVKACAGVFPEIWGVVPMSNSTERLLTP